LLVWGYLLFISKFFEVVEICSKRCLRITQKFLEGRQEVPKKKWSPHIYAAASQLIKIIFIPAYFGNSGEN